MEVRIEQFPKDYIISIQNGQVVWTDENVEFCASGLHEPIDYPGAAVDISLALDRRAEGVALVVGSMSPWIEGILLQKKSLSSIVWTTDVNKVTCFSDRINSVSAETLAKFEGAFSTIVSFSTIEHIGLGRYGDPIDQDGDIKFVHNDVMRLLKPGGQFIIGVPLKVGDTNVCKPWHRIYGRERLHWMLSPLKIEQSVWQGYISPEINFYHDPQLCADWQHQPVIACRKV